MVLSKPEDKNVMKMFSLAGKVAAVTGGARGIGLDVSKAFAEAGANVAVIYGTFKEAPKIAADIGSENKVKCQAYQADVRKPDSITEVIARIAKDFGGLDIVVANAGVTANIPAEDCSPEDFSNVMKVNLDGVFYTSQAASKIFKPQGHGNLIITGSVSAQLVNLPQKQAAYNASKAGVVHLAKCLAVEWVDWCRVNCISPGFIATEMLETMPDDYKKTWLSMVPAQRFCDPYELKGAYVFCASDASSYMTGSNIVIDGAYTLP